MSFEGIAFLLERASVYSLPLNLFFVFSVCEWYSYMGTEPL